MFTTKPKPAYQEMLRRMRSCRPRNRRELAAYVRAFLGLKIPGKRICAGHDSPLDYLAYAFLGEDCQRPVMEQDMLMSEDGQKHATQPETEYDMLKSEDGRKHATRQIIYPRILHAGLETRGVEPHPTGLDSRLRGNDMVGSGNDTKEILPLRLRSGLKAVCAQDDNGAWATGPPYEKLFTGESV